MSMVALTSLLVFMEATMSFVAVSIATLLLMAIS